VVTAVENTLQVRVTNTSTNREWCRIAVENT